MSQRQRYERQNRVRTGPPANCARCGAAVDALPMFEALAAFEGDDFESWVVTDGLTMLQAQVGPGAMVSFCEACVCFASTTPDGAPADFTISA